MSFIRFLITLLPFVAICSGLPVNQRIVDLTHEFNNLTLNYPTVSPFNLTLIVNESNPNGYWIQLEKYSSSTHAGTHMDAPCHFANGRWCVDEIPLNHFIAPAAVIDITKKTFLDRDAFVQVADLENWENISGQSLDGTIVMIRTGWYKKWPHKEAYTGTSSNDPTAMHFPGVSEEAAQWLVQNRLIYGLGIDTLSLDNGPSLTLMAHRLLLGNNIYGLENVANLGKIPVYGATLYVMPMRITAASGAPVRIVATFSGSINILEDAWLHMSNPE